MVCCLYRSKLGVSGIAVHQHGAKILKAGWSAKKCSDVCAFEVDSSSDHSSSLASSNDQLVRLAGGLLPQLSGLRLVSVGGAHTNSFLRAVKARCPTPVPFLQGANGLLDPDALSAGRPAFQDALQTGLEWLVLDARLHKHLNHVYANLSSWCLSLQSCFHDNYDYD